MRPRPADQRQRPRPGIPEASQLLSEKLADPPPVKITLRRHTRMLERPGRMQHALSRPWARLTSGSPRGGRAIGEVIARLVQATASRWSIDQVVCDPGSHRAVIEWTVRRTGALARGAEWYESDPGTGLITEIRAYLASPPAAGASRLELEGSPYAERGYTMDS